MYIHPSSKNLPSLFTSPRLWLRALQRRIVAFGTNTMMVAQFRFRSKLKPHFGQMKSLAIQRYVEVNQKFAAGDLNGLRPYVSNFVMKPMSERLKSIPPGVKHNWKLVKFNSTPRAMAVLPMMLPGTPLAHIMVVYRIASRQRLAKVTRGQSEPEVVERDVVDYPAFIFDVSRKPYETVLIGSLFESKCCVCQIKQHPKAKTNISAHNSAKAQDQPGHGREADDVQYGASRRHFPCPAKVQCA